MFFETSENEVCGSSSEDDVGGVHGESVRLKSEPAPSHDFCVELNENDHAICRLPDDGGIFYEGIPFHHYSLTPLTDAHYRRLLANGGFWLCCLKNFLFLFRSLIFVKQIF